MSMQFVHSLICEAPSLTKSTIAGEGTAIDERAGLPILAFGDAGSFEAWLVAQGKGAPGLWLKLAKNGAPEPTLSKAAAIDAALCQGWIDGQLDRFDQHHWLVRFTPRRPRSKWSQVNCVRATELIEEGRMGLAGLEQIAAAKADGRWDDAYAPASTAELPADLSAALAANPDASTFFKTLTGANRYAILYRLGAAKRPETRARKVAEFVAMLQRSETIHG